VTKNALVKGKAQEHRSPAKILDDFKEMAEICIRELEAALPNKEEPIAQSETRRYGCYIVSDTGDLNGSYSKNIRDAIKIVQTRTGLPLGICVIEKELRKKGWSKHFGYSFVAPDLYEAQQDDEELHPETYQGDLFR
jgi:hypothetical protein